MNAKQKLHQIHMQEWASRFADQKASGLTVRQWCEQHDISIHKYNYWKHQLKEEAVDRLLPDIVPLSLSDPHMSVPVCPADACTVIDRTNPSNCTNPTSVHFNINGFSIDMDPLVPEAFLFSLIKAVRHA